jgi:hypothetical protein
MIILSGVQVIAAGLSFVCTPVAVWDGDGPIWCAEGPRIRLAGVAARELDGTCRLSQPCPSQSGTEARDTLVRLLGGSKGKLRTGTRKSSWAEDGLPLNRACRGLTNSGLVRSTETGRFIVRYAYFGSSRALASLLEGSRMLAPGQGH